MANPIEDIPYHQANIESNLLSIAFSPKLTIRDVCLNFEACFFFNGEQRTIGVSVLASFGHKKSQHKSNPNDD